MTGDVRIVDDSRSKGKAKATELKLLCLFPALLVAEAGEPLHLLELDVIEFQHGWRQPAP